MHRVTHEDLEAAFTASSDRGYQDIVDLLLKYKAKLMQ